MFVLGPHWSRAVGTLNRKFGDLKPGELCSSYICLMVAAAALAKPKSELRAGGPRPSPVPGREAPGQGETGPSLPRATGLGQLRVGRGHGGRSRLSWEQRLPRRPAFLLFLMDKRAEC